MRPQSEFGCSVKTLAGQIKESASYAVMTTSGPRRKSVRQFLILSYEQRTRLVREQADFKAREMP